MLSKYHLCSICNICFCPTIVICSRIHFQISLTENACIQHIRHTTTLHPHIPRSRFRLVHGHARVDDPRDAISHRRLAVTGTGICRSRSPGVGCAARSLQARPGWLGLRLCWWSAQRRTVWICSHHWRKRDESQTRAGDRRVPLLVSARQRPIPPPIEFAP